MFKMNVCVCALSFHVESNYYGQSIILNAMHGNTNTLFMRGVGIEKELHNREEPYLKITPI